jgi:hypothetical protein
LCCLSFDLQILITIVVFSFGYCVLSFDLDYNYHWCFFLLAIVLSLLWFTDSDYHCCFFFWLLCSLLWFTDYNYHCCFFFWLLCCLSFDLQILITIVVFFFWLLCCLSFDLQILITIVVFSFGYCVVSFDLQIDYHCYFFWLLCCLPFDLQILITIVVFSFGYCVVSPLIYRFWLPLLFFLLAIVLSPLWFTDSDYHCCFFFWLLCCLPFDLQILITIVVFSFGYCVVSSLIYRFWLPLSFFLLAIVLSPLWFTDSDYHCRFFFWLLCCLPFDLQILITIVVFSFGYCVVSPLI